MLPFTHGQFVEVFARYNIAVWPAQHVAYLLAVAMLFALRRPSRQGDRRIGAGLAAMWLWTGIAYHALHFSRINPAAILFGALFVVQAALFAHATSTGKLRFGAFRGAAPCAGWGLVLYATLVYPLIGLWSGPGYPGMPTFGITPCPVTIFTWGLLLLARPPVPLRLLVIPAAWSVVGGSAAILLGVAQDWLLLASGFAALWIGWPPRRRWAA